MKIADRPIGPDQPPFIIAEMSGNHNQSLDRALAIVEAAAAAGVHALKLQTYTADSMTLNINEGKFFIDDQDSPWSGTSLYDLYTKAQTPWEWHAPIFERCRDLGLVCFSTPFDATGVDFLESLDTPCYKIASFENTDIPLIRRVSATGKPVIISAGMATIAELDDAVRAAGEAGCKDLILLKCTSTYPTTPENSNLLTIPHMQRLFRCEVGLSDHTLGIGVALAGVAVGATVIEKHFTLLRAGGGVDAAFSLEPKEMLALVAESKHAWQSLGQVHYGPTEAERKSLAYRRSLHITMDLDAGELLTHENVRAVRPGGGLSPKHLEVVVGLRVTHSVARGTPVTWDLVRS